MSAASGTISHGMHKGIAAVVPQCPYRQLNSAGSAGKTGNDAGSGGNVQPFFHFRRLSCMPAPVYTPVRTITDDATRAAARRATAPARASFRAGDGGRRRAGGAARFRSLCRRRSLHGHPGEPRNRLCDGALYALQPFQPATWSGLGTHAAITTNSTVTVVITSALGLANLLLTALGTAALIAAAGLRTLGQPCDSARRTGRPAAATGR